MNTPVIAQVYAPYGPSHWSLLALTVLGGVMLVLLGRRHRGTPAADLFSRAFGAVLLVAAAGFLLWGLLPGNFDRTQSIPLQLSDLMRFVCGYALWSKRRWALALTYYWGLTLNPQALLTPSLVYVSVPAVDFASYWVLHILVMWAPIYLVWGLGNRPDWRSYRTALLITVGWAAVTFTVNSIIGTNYGYLNRKPSSTTVLDLLGPWPVYLAVEVAAVIIVWALITLPWTVRRRMIRRRTGMPASPG